MKPGRPAKITVGKPTYYARNRERCLANVKARQARLGDSYRAANADHQRRQRALRSARLQPDLPPRSTCLCDICTDPKP
jgi:hypothetical protein